MREARNERNMNIALLSQGRLSMIVGVFAVTQGSFFLTY